MVTLLAMESRHPPPADRHRSSEQMTASPQWTITDGWILMSVYFTLGEDGSPLDELIGAADAMNHAIPTHAELSLALTRLASCGVLDVHGDRYQIAMQYLPGIKAANDRRGGLFATPDKGKKWLASMEFATTKSRRVEVTEEQLSDAYDHYRKRLAKPTDDRPE